MKDLQSTGEIFRLGATEIARLVKKREISCREAVSAHLDRIDQVNERVNAVVKVLSDRALEQADELDRRIGCSSDNRPAIRRWSRAGCCRDY
ncbi:MAG: amidase family protein [Salinivirgaceae bacterium]|nr:amidase family protein [Salinivirgaceae bacterium]